MKLPLVIFLLCTGLLGCRYFSEKKYRIGQNFYFNHKYDFINYLKKKKSLPIQQYLYVDSVDYSRFVFNQLQQNKSGVYIGAFLNDSMEIKKSMLLRNNVFCSGRIENEIMTIASMKKHPDSILQITHEISNYSLRFLESGAAFDINKNKEKITFIMVYSYGMGNYYDKLFQNVSSLKNVYVICTDPVYKLKE